MNWKVLIIVEAAVFGNGQMIIALELQSNAT